MHHPRLSLATLDAENDSASSNAYQRISSVCRQFLDWHVENESTVARLGNVSEHIAMWSCVTRNKAQLANAPQWQVVADFLAKAKKSPERAALASPTNSQPIQPQTIRQPEPVIENHPEEAIIAPKIAASDSSEVIDLPDAQANPASIVHAILHGSGDLVECPVKPPMCPEASLAVSRDRRLILIAVARQGLNDLRQIGRAYQWLIENRALVAMAVPQISIDAHQLPIVRLLVDHADMTADLLQPIVQSGSVLVQAYRKLHWAGKTGLLLEAA